MKIDWSVTLDGWRVDVFDGCEHVVFYKFKWWQGAEFNTLCRRLIKATRS